MSVQNIPYRLPNQRADLLQCDKRDAGRRREAQREADKRRYEVNCSKRGKQEVRDNERQMEVGKKTKNKGDFARVAPSLN